MIDDSTQYIARISHGKDSLKMLEVIKSRGLPLDRITTTDVWATDTISARLPPMEEFVARMDQKIWDMYRIQVEHLCAQNPDGSKRTYEQMFYHIPKRKNAGGGGSCHWEQSSDSRICGTSGVKPDSNGVPMHRIQGSIKGFPGTLGVNWCQKLKIHWLGNQGISSLPEGERSQVVPRPQDNLCFQLSAPRGAKTEILWNTSALLPTSLPGSDSWVSGSVRRWWSSALTRICAACTASITICWGRRMKPPAGTAAGSATTRASTSSAPCAGTGPTIGPCC